MSSDAEDDAAPRGSRVEHSLGTFTRRFVDFIRSVPAGPVDLNEAAEFLNVKKRRVYDITGVLEGVDAITKISKNTVVWR